MYFEVFLEIIVAIFAVFGLFCLIKLVDVIWFGCDNVRVTVEVDTPDTAEYICDFLKEAENTCLVWGGREIAVLVRSEFADEKLLKKLEQKRVKYYII